MTTTPATPIDPKAKVLVRIAGHKSLPLEYAIASDKTKLALALTTFVDGMDGAEISDVETGPDGLARKIAPVRIGGRLAPNLPPFWG